MEEISCSSVICLNAVGFGPPTEHFRAPMRFALKFHLPRIVFIRPDIIFYLAHKFKLPNHLAWNFISLCILFPGRFWKLNVAFGRLLQTGGRNDKLLMPGGFCRQA